MPWSADTLPKVVLMGLDRGESKLGRILMWVIGGFALLLAVLMVALPDPNDEVPEVAPWFFGGTGLMFAYAWWLSRKYLRVHRSSVAELLRRRAHTITEVSEQVRRAATGSVEMVSMPFDGDREFRARTVDGGNVVGIRTKAYSWFRLKVRGKWVTRKVVVPTDHAHEVARWLLTLLADKSPECRWGERTAAEVARERSA